MENTRTPPVRPTEFTNLLSSLPSKGSARELQHLPEAALFLAEMAAWAYAEESDFKEVLGQMFPGVPWRCVTLSLSREPERGAPPAAKSRRKELASDGTAPC